MVDDLLGKARRDPLAEGWSREQVEAALDYAERWAEGNAGIGAGGDGRLRETLVRNYPPQGASSRPASGSPALGPSGLPGDSHSFLVLGLARHFVVRRSPNIHNAPRCSC